MPGSAQQGSSSPLLAQRGDSESSFAAAAAPAQLPIAATGRAEENAQQQERQQQQQASTSSVPSPCSLFASCARPAVAALLPARYADVGQWTTAPHQLPLVYSPSYNITFFGIEKLHPFDACKFHKVLRSLEAGGVVRRGQTVAPLEAPRQLLLDVHTPEYVQALHSSNLKVVKVTELPALIMLPNFLLQQRIITPMKVHVGGTVLAAGLAMQHGWAINLGGGMHHAFASDGMGWCPFDDIYLAIRRLRAASGGGVKRVMLIDLDAHQGNGVERDKLTFKDNDLFILDAYNSWVFPQDHEAKEAIDIALELRPRIGGEEYVARLEHALEHAEQRFPSPDLIVFNAGTDVLVGDPLGRLSVGPEEVVRRDETVWRYALRQRAPILMLLSGGYAKDSAPVISQSITNLFKQFGLNAPSPPVPEAAPLEEEAEQQALEQPAVEGVREGVREAEMATSTVAADKAEPRE